MTNRAPQVQPGVAWKDIRFDRAIKLGICRNCHRGYDADCLAWNEPDATVASYLLGGEWHVVMRLLPFIWSHEADESRAILKFFDRVTRIAICTHLLY